MRILVIDSEAIILELISMIFKSKGYEVFATKDYVEAENILNNKKPDVILSEYYEKREPCHSFHLNVQKMPNPPSVVVMLGGGFITAPQEVLEIGVDEYLYKPFSNDTLVEHVERAYAKKELKDKIAELRSKLTIPFENQTVRSIEFAPEHYQAGLSILGYFNTIVNQKYPDLKVKIRIEQEDMVVRMVVESPDGSKDKVEKTLEEFGLVVKGDLPPEALLENQLEVMALKNKLELTSLELRQARELHRICENKNSERVDNLELQVAHLQHLVGEGLKGVSKNSDLLFRVLDKALVGSDVKTQIENILERVDRGLKQSDEKEVKQILQTIKNANPDLLIELRGFAMNSIAGVSGSFLYSWIVSTLKNL